LRPGGGIERPFVLGVKSPTPEQIATGRVYQTEPDDFAFYPAMRRVAWNSKLSPDAQAMEEEAGEVGEEKA